VSDMARIIDEVMEWKLEIFPEATPVENINEPTQGYRALLGFDNSTDRHVIMYVWYDKDKFAIGDVLSKINSMKNCSRCDTLDRERLNELSIEPAARPDPYYNPVQTPVSQPAQTDYGTLSPPGRPAVHTPVPNPPTYAPNPSTPAPGTRTDVKSMFADAMFDAYLTPAGKLMWGNVFGDTALVESAYPKNVNEMSRLVEQTTAGEFLRNPEEAKEFFAAIHSGDPDDAPGSSGQSKVRKTKGIVIY